MSPSHQPVGPHTPKTSTLRNKKPQCCNHKPKNWHNSPEVLFVHCGNSFCWLHSACELHFLWMDSTLTSILHSPLSLCTDNTSTALNQKSLHIPSARQILMNTPQLSSAFSTQYRTSMDISYRSFFLETHFLTVFTKNPKDNLKYYNKGCIQKFCSFCTVNIK